MVFGPPLDAVLPVIKIFLAFFIIVIGNGFMHMNYQFYYLKIAQGVVILLGLGLVSMLRRQYLNR